MTKCNIYMTNMLAYKIDFTFKETSKNHKPEAQYPIVNIVNLAKIETCRYIYIEIYIRLFRT